MKISFYRFYLRVKNALRVLPIVAVFVFIGGIFLMGARNRLKMLAQNSPLPPGISETNFAPIPESLERHLGQDWIIASSKTNWATVVYYPKYIEIRSLRRVPIGQSGNGAAHTNGEAFEINAALNGSTEDFVLVPLNPGLPTLFMAAQDTDIARMKARIKPQAPK